MKCVLCSCVVLLYICCHNFHFPRSIRFTTALPCPLPPPPRLRKDPLDPIDSGTKVRAIFERMTNPEIEAEEKRRKAEMEKRAKEAAASGKQDRTQKKAGAWGGLPGRELERACLAARPQGGGCL